MQYFDSPKFVLQINHRQTQIGRVTHETIKLRRDALKSGNYTFLHH